MQTIFNLPVSRRRALFIGAVMAGTAVSGVALPFAAAGAPPIHRWSGQALGAHATMELVGSTPERAHAAIQAAVGEIRRLEAIFSLYDADSELSRLNRNGELAAPEPDLLELLGEARAAFLQTGGLFDPTVQPLFDLYARHFTTPGADPNGPPPKALQAALDRVGFDAVSFDEEVIRFARPGMGITLNGIAQGYITDKVAALLRSRGFENMLLDLGEIRALGTGRSRRGWVIGIEGKDERLQLVDKAVATSRPLGTVLDPAGRFGHIFDPRRGFVPTRLSQATVVADRAATADALSTAVVLMGERQLAEQERPGVRIITLPVV